MNFASKQKELDRNQLGQTNGRKLLNAKLFSISDRDRIDLLFGNKQQNLMAAVFQDLGDG